MLDQALGLLDHHFGHLHVANRRFVEGRGHDLALHRPLHVGHFLRPLVDQEHDQVALGVIGGDRLGDVLQEHGLAGARRRDDQRALALADRRDDVDDARRHVLAGRVLDLELQPLVRIERRQIVEMDLVPRLLRVLEIDRVALQQREIALALLRAANHAFDRVAGAQAEPPDLGRRNIDVVGAGEVVGVGRAQEGEAVLQDLDDALADDLDVDARQLLEDGEHQLLLAHGRGVLDLVLLGEREEFGRRFLLQVLEFDFPHRRTFASDGRADEPCRRDMEWRVESALRKSAASDGPPWPDEPCGPRPGVRRVDDKRRSHSRLRRQFSTGNCSAAPSLCGADQNGFRTTSSTIRIIRSVGTSLRMR